MPGSCWAVSSWPRHDPSASSWTRHDPAPVRARHTHGRILTGSLAVPLRFAVSSSRPRRSELMRLDTTRPSCMVRPDNQEGEADGYNGGSGRGRQPDGNRRQYRSAVRAVAIDAVSEGHLRDHRDGLVVRFDRPGGAHVRPGAHQRGVQLHDRTGRSLRQFKLLRDVPGSQRGCSPTAWEERRSFSSA